MGVPLHKILKKCSYQNRGNLWGGYLQPVEIIRLIESGYNPANPNYNVLEDAERKKSIGMCNPRWFYFIRNRRMGEWV